MEATWVEKLSELYGRDGAAAQAVRYEKAIAEYKSVYGGAVAELGGIAEPGGSSELGELAVFSAPGRTEVCGNHTDHQHGKVLAAAIDSDAIAVAAVNNDNKVRITAEGFGSFEIDLGQAVQAGGSDLDQAQPEGGSGLDQASNFPRAGGTTQDLVSGVLDGIKRAGGKFGGFNAYITSDVLVGSGLSSSAAFELLIGTVINGLFNEMSFSPVELAKIGQYAENEFFGKPCGLMDQLASAVGGLCFMDFADPSEPVIKRVDCDFGSFGYDLCITNTGGSHADLTGDYAAVRSEMEAVAGCFGKEHLRGIEVSDLIADAAAIREKCGDRALLRAIHFCMENERVEAQVAALEGGRIADFLALVKASGDSSFKYLQNVYPPASAAFEQNVSVALAVSDAFINGACSGAGAREAAGAFVEAGAQEAAGACRVHGGGFAGTIQAFIIKSKSEEYRRLMDSVFGEGACRVYSIRKQGAVRVL